MAKISTSDFKTGVAIVYENEPYMIVNVDFVSPGKGRAFARTKMKGIKTDKVIEYSFTSGDMVEEVDVMHKTQTFLYSEGDVFTFMDPDSYDQYELSGETLGLASKFLQDGMDVPVKFLDGQPFTIMLPKKMSFEITDTAEGVKGDTKTNATKDATISNGMSIQVPLFIKKGEMVNINTEDGSYSERTQ